MNVANLLLSESFGVARRRSFRSGRRSEPVEGVFIRQLLTESLLLGGVGASVGVALVFGLYT